MRGLRNARLPALWEDSSFSQGRQEDSSWLRCAFFAGFVQFRHSEVMRGASARHLPKTSSAFRDLMLAFPPSQPLARAAPLGLVRQACELQTKNAQAHVSQPRL